MTSLFARLRTLDKEATDALWHVVGLPWNEGAPFINAGSADPHGGEVVCDFTYTGDDADWRETNNSDVNAELIVECRNSLPAVLNLIEAAQRVIAVADESDVMAVMLSEAVAVFVSGQEEPASYERCERLHVGGDSCTSEKGHAGACTFGVAIEPKRVSGQEEPTP